MVLRKDHLMLVINKIVYINKVIVWINKHSIMELIRISMNIKIIKTMIYSIYIRIVYKFIRIMKILR
jgi:hypothetical protein